MNGSEIHIKFHTVCAFFTCARRKAMREDSTVHIERGHLHTHHDYNQVIDILVTYFL